MSLSADSATAMFSSEKITGLRMKGQKLRRSAIHGKRLTVESGSRRPRDDRMKPALYARCLGFAVSHLRRAGCDRLASALLYQRSDFRGAIVRIGLASDQLGFEHRERLKAGVTRQGHAAEDLSAEQAGEYRAITDQLASAIRRGRLERGVLEGNEKIVDIALGVGFESQAHFPTVSGNLVGMTPRQFQRSSERGSGRVFRPLLPVVECC